MAAATLLSLEQSITASSSSSSNNSSSSVAPVNATAHITTGSTTSSTTTLSLSRARRRPTRYSPEPIISNSSNNNNSSQQNLLTLHQQLLNANGTLNDLGVHDASIQHAQQMMLQQENEDSEESNEVLANGEMAPAAVVAPTRKTKQRTKRRYNKKRQRNDDGGKRPRVANVLLENEQIIDEIRARKALWMRTHEQHHSSLLTAPLWEEIANTLETSHENIRRRWKSLKDHYRRELKKFMTDPTAPPSTWPYYKKMRFMKSQMFVSLRRKNGEDHLEILSDDEEELNNEWNGQVVRSKVENGSETLDGYELNQNYDEMVKYEQHLQQLNQNGEMAAQEEAEEEEEDEHQQQQQQHQDEQVEQEEQDPISPTSSLHEQEEHQLSAMQQQANLSDITNLTRMQPQPVITSDIATITTMVNGIPATIVTTASGNMSAQHCEQLASRLNAMQQQQQISHHMNAAMQRGQPREIPQDEEEDDNLAEMNARHSQLAQQRASINNQLNDIQRRAEMSALHQRANITAMHRTAEMSTMQHRAEMQQQRNAGLDNTSSVEITDDRGAISDDYHFFMSLMPHVKNFTSLQKLKMRNRIQQIIIEEASNGPQYDPLANC